MLSLLLILIAFAESLHPERYSKEDIKSLILGEWKNCVILEEETPQGSYVFLFHPESIVRNEKGSNRMTHAKKGIWDVRVSSITPGELIIELEFDDDAKQCYTIVEAGEKHVRLRLERGSRAHPRIVMKLSR